jgi:ribose 5-phosphate isomerase B
MRIAVAADHAGFAFKRRLVDELQGLGHEVVDFGTNSSQSCDYPDHGIPAARSVAQGQNHRAILVCNNGIGMSMVANKIPGVRGAMVYSEKTAAATRGHHDSNVLCLGAQQFSEEDLLRFVQVWLDTEFEGGRHARRVKKIDEMDGS